MTWTSKADIPGGSTTSIREHGAVAIGDKIYVTGGYLPNVFLGPPGAYAWEYDEPSDTWTALTDLPAARAAHGCDTISGKVYVAGGEDASSAKNTLYEYDPSLDTWTSKATMPAARTNAAGVAVGSTLYMIGGASTITGSALTSLYAWTSNSWTTLTSLPAARQSAGAVAVGTDIYVFGGNDSGGSPTDTVWIYDTLTDTWDDTSLGPMPVADELFGMAVRRDTDVYVCGGIASGFDTGGSADYDKSTLRVYDTLTDTWTDMGDPLPVFRWVVTNAGTPSYFYVIAGWSGNETTNTLYRWQASGSSADDQWHVGAAKSGGGWA